MRHRWPIVVQCVAASAILILAVIVFRPARANALQTVERAPIAIRDACQVSVALEGCHVHQALSHNGKLYFLIKGSQQGSPFSGIVTTSEDGDGPTLTPLGSVDVISFTLDGRNRLAYLAKQASDISIHLREENSISSKSHTVSNLGGDTMRLAATGLGIVAFGIGHMVPLISDGAFLDTAALATPVELGQFLFAVPFGREQLAVIGQTTGVTQLYSGNAFTGTTSVVDFQQVPFPDFQKNLPSMGNSASRRAILVDASSTPDGALLLQVAGYKLSMGAIVIETAPLDPKMIARIFRLQLGASDRIKTPDNPTGQMFPGCIVASSRTLVLSEKTSGIFSVYQR